MDKRAGGANSRANSWVWDDTNERANSRAARLVPDRANSWALGKTDEKVDKANSWPFIFTTNRANG